MIITSIIIIQNYLIINSHKIHSIIIISRSISALLVLLLKLILFFYNNLGYETYLYFLLTNYIYENNELIVSKWPPKPNPASFVPKIPIGDLPGSGGPPGPPGPPYDFHTYLAINNDHYERDDIKKADIDSVFHEYFARWDGSKNYTGLGLKGQVHYKSGYKFERAEIFFPTKTKIDIYDEHTFCRHVLAHNYWVNLQINPEDYIRKCTKAHEAYMKSIEESKKRIKESFSTSSSNKDIVGEDRIRIPNLLNPIDNE